MMVLAIGRGGQLEVAEQFKNLNAGAIDVVCEGESEEESAVAGLLGSAPVMEIHPFSAAKFIRRGGRIPAPMHSLKN